ncbi:MAG: hypothetical protein ABFS41_13680 [Myxococcota bacterium]
MLWWMLLMRLFHRLRAVSLAAGAALVLPVGAGALTGVCPDGSIYIVQDARQIPCAEAKAVEGHEVPPIRPHYLPTPYTWKVWNERHNPNNAYNVIDAARQVRELEAPPPGVAGAAPPEAAPSTASAPAAAGAPVSLGLSEQELRDLFQIVELSQEHVPARLARETADGQGVFEVSFAHSAAFEGMLRESWAARGGLPSGGVLLFSARSVRPEEFYASFTFLQQHLTYQPDATDVRQLGLLQGRFGPLAAGEVVLGYVSLPPNFTLDGELDLYWDDRHTVAQFAR